jgi:hypothetical protein
MAFVIDESVEINASKELVWQVLTDFGRYGEWNTFCFECTATLEPGTPIVMRERLLTRRESVQREVIRSHTPGVEFSHTLKPVPLRALHSVRSHTVTPLGPERCRYDSHFELAGWLHPVVVAFLASAFKRGFGSMTAGLVRRAEQLA